MPWYHTVAPNSEMSRRAFAVSRRARGPRLCRKLPDESFLVDVNQAHLSFLDTLKGRFGVRYRGPLSGREIDDLMKGKQANSPKAVSPEGLSRYAVWGDRSKLKKCRRALASLDIACADTNISGCFCAWVDAQRQSRFEELVRDHGFRFVSAPEGINLRVMLTEVKKGEQTMQPQVSVPAIAAAATVTPEAAVLANGAKEEVPEAPQETEIDRIRREEGIGPVTREKHKAVRPSREVLRRLRGKYSRKTISELLGVADSTLHKWIHEDAKPPRAAEREMPQRETPAPTTIKAALGALKEQRDLLVAEREQRKAELAKAEAAVAQFDEEVRKELRETGIMPVAAS